MSRRLTLQRGLQSLPVTSGDLGGNDPLTLAGGFPYLYEQSGLKVLNKRAVDAVSSLGLDLSFANNFNFLNAGQADNMRAKTTPNANGAIIQDRIYEMARVLIALVPSFNANVRKLEANGYSRSQAITRGVQEFNVLFMEQLKILDLVTPSVFARSKMMSILNNKEAVDRLYNFLVYEQDRS